MTLDFLSHFYPWTKALHVISVIAWMAALFYLPRLFVYHHETAAGSAEEARFVVMERRLARAIMGPAMHATWTFGLMLVLTPGVVDWSAGWWHVKFASVVGMTVFHTVLARAQRRFAKGERVGSGRYWRVMNEAPTVLMVVIVVMVVVRPF